MNSRPEYSIVVPCYNEGGNLRSLVQQFSEFIGNYSAELILVDNGSTDDTFSMKDEFCLVYPFVRWVTIEKNKGYGHGIFTGIKSASGKYIVYTHADLQTDPQDVEKAILLCKQEGKTNVLIKGCRTGRKPVAVFFSRGLERVSSLILGTRLTEINAQPNLFSAELVGLLTNPPDHWGFDLYLYYTATQTQCQIIRFDVIFPERKAGKSKWKENIFSVVRLSWRMVNYCFKLKTGI